MKRVAVVMGCLANLIVLASPVLAKKDEANKTAAVVESLRIEDWVALGSGCKGSLKEEGNVKIAMQKDPNQPLRYVIDVTYEHYRLDGADPIRPENATFARECSLRLAMYPSSLHRIRQISAKTALSIDKSEGARALIRTRTALIQGDLASWSQEYEKNSAVKKNEMIDLQPDIKGLEILKAIPCGKPKIVSFDTSFTNYRDNFTPTVDIKADPKGTRIIIDLEGCLATKEAEKPAGQ